MPLPFSLVVEPPNRADLCRLRRPHTFVVVVDGEARGTTPLSMSVGDGDHHVSFQRSGFLEQDQLVHATPGRPTAISVALWRETPDVTPLRPVLPGATIADAAFLSDGRVVLAVAMPPDGRREIWLLDRPGHPVLVGPPEALPLLAISPDGQELAYLAAAARPGSGTGATPSRLTDLRVRHVGDELAKTWYTLPPTAVGAQISSISWAPSGKGLLVVSSRRLAATSPESTLVWVSAPRDSHSPGATRELVTLPSEVVPDSFTWNPGGDQVAFLAATGSTMVLCLTDTATAGFYYLANLSRGDSTAVSFPPVAWSNSGQRFAYTALRDGSGPSGGWLFGSGPSRGLFLDDGTGNPSRQLGSVDEQAPVWWDADSIAVLLQPRHDGPLTLSVVDLTGTSRMLGLIPLSPQGPISARWDLTRAQAILAVPTTSGIGSSGREYWLVRWRPEQER
jgi:hypothetical protein